MYNGCSSNIIYTFYLIDYVMLLKQFKYIVTQTFRILLKIIIDIYQHFIYTFYAYWVKQNNSTTHKFMTRQLL